MSKASFQPSWSRDTLHVLCKWRSGLLVPSKPDAGGSAGHAPCLQKFQFLALSCWLEVRGGTPEQRGVARKRLSNSLALVCVQQGDAEVCDLNGSQGPWGSRKPKFRLCYLFTHQFLSAVVLTSSEPSLDVWRVCPTGRTNHAAIYVTVEPP